MLIRRGGGLGKGCRDIYSLKGFTSAQKCVAGREGKAGTFGECKHGVSKIMETQETTMENMCVHIYKGIYIYPYKTLVVIECSMCFSIPFDSLD